MENENIRLRPASAGDEDFLRLVYAESRREELDQVAWPEGAREAFLRQQFDAQTTNYRENYTGAEYFVVERGGVPAGRLYVHRREAEIRIMEIGLLPEERGKGVGTALLQELLDEGLAAGKIVSIHVEKFNPALRLYERLGFQIAAEHGVYWLLQRKPAAAAGAG